MSEKKKQTEERLLSELTSSEYKYGFTTDIESDTIPKGLSEEVSVSTAITDCSFKIFIHLSKTFSLVILS